MELIYNVHYEVAACCFLAMMYIFLIIQYTDPSKRAREFRGLVLISLLGTVLDVITAVTISYGSFIPPAFNIIINTVFFLSFSELGYRFTHYVTHCVYSGDEPIETGIVLKTAYVLHNSMFVINLFTGITFTFNEDGEYIKGPAYPLNLLIPLFFALYSGYIIMYKKNSFTRRQKICTLCFIVLVVMGPLLQLFFFPDVLLGMFTVAVAIFIMQFSLETPDYKALVHTMNELNVTKEKAENASIQAIEANRAKNDFLANVSHEIRTPINAIINMNEMIMRESIAPSVKEYAVHIQTASNNLMNMINDILDFSKIESGKMELTEQEYQLSTVLFDVINMIKVKAQSKNLEFNINVDEKLPNNLTGDDVRIRQVLINLLNNAIKYTLNGSVTLNITKFSKNDNTITLKIEVRDTGMGIRESDLPDLFSDFKRLNLKETRHIEGTGLGLPITKSIVEQMNGRITVESEYGKGSAFTVYLPQVFHGNESIGNFENRFSDILSKGEVYKESFTAPDAEILAVDDNEMNLFVLEKLLADTKVKLTKAMSGKEMLELIKHKQYDIILLDHMMPIMDGIETLKASRELADNMSIDTPVIALTANAAPGIRTLYMNEGFTDYLSKPVDYRKLEAIIIKYLPANKSIYASEPAPTVTKAESEFLNKLSFIDTASGMKYCGNNEGFYREMIMLFTESNFDKEIENAIDCKDISLYMTQLNALESSACAIGAYELADAVRKLEADAVGQDADALNEMTAEVIEKYNELTKKLCRCNA